MARILIETDGGAVTLSENLQLTELGDGNHADRLVERIGWALSDAEQADDRDPALTPSERVTQTYVSELAGQMARPQFGVPA